MSLTLQTTFFSYVANGVTTSFPYTCRIWQAHDLRVTVITNGVGAEPTNYTVSGMGGNSGGTVTFTTPPIIGSAILIERRLALNRHTTYLQAGDFRAATVNNDQDYQTALIQQHELDRNATETRLRGEIYGLGLAVSVADLGMVDNLEQAVAAFGAAYGTITIGTSQTLTGDLLLHENLVLRVINPAVINIPDGSTLAIVGNLEAGRYQIFSGNGVVAFNKGTYWNDTHQQAKTRTVYPEWWGPDSGALQKACYAIAAQTAGSTYPTYVGGIVSLSPHYYQIDDTLTIPDHVWVDGGGGGIRQSCIQASNSWASASNAVVRIGRPLDTAYWSSDSRIRNCTVDGNFQANTAIYTDSCNEGSGVENVFVRNALIHGIQVYEHFTGPTIPRPAHAFIRDCHIVFPIATNPTYYPSPSILRGIAFLGTHSAPRPFVNFSVDKITVTAVPGQDDNAPILMGAGISIEGMSGISITNSHTEYCNIGILIGTTSFPAYNIRVQMYDDYQYNATCIKICNNASYGFIFENIDSNNVNNGEGITIDDARTGGGQVSGRYITRWSDGYHTFVANIDFQGNTTDSASYRFSRSRNGEFIPQSGTIASFEHTEGPTLGIVSIAGGIGGRLDLVDASNSANVVNLRADNTGTLRLYASGGYEILAIPVYVGNEAAVSAGLGINRIYRNGDNLCLVHA